MGRRQLHTRAYDFLEYRAYLNAIYQEKKSSGEGFTYREFAGLCGLSSAGAIKLVLDGKRRLSLSKAQQVAKLLRLPGEEAEFFLNLVRFNDAKDDGERNAAFDKLKAAVAFRRTQENAIRQFEYYKKWYYVAVRELVNLDGFREDPKWIASRLTPSITTAQARAAVQKLLKLGYLVRDPEGILRQAQPVISTEPEVASLAVKNFHREMMDRAKESLESQTSDRRDVRCVTVAISEGQAERIKQMNTQYMKDVLDVVAEDDGVDVVCQLNLQWFRLSLTQEDDPKGSAKGKVAREERK